MPLYRAELLAKKPLRYAALIHDVSQVLHLPFDYDDGSYARDRSGYGNHGTIYGATKADGKIGMSRRFDGVDDYVEVPDDPSLDITEELTLLTWIKTDINPASGASRGIITKGRFPYNILLSNGPVLRANWRDSTNTWHDLYGATTLNLGEWYHAAFVFKADEFSRLYLNGVLDGSLGGTPSLVTDTNPVWVGRWVYEGVWFEGIIDEVRISSRALSQDEIRMLMYRRLV